MTAVPLLANLDAAPRPVLHAELERDTSESAYRSMCPACTEGMLFVARDPKTFRLLREDRCTWCSQRVVYQDENIGGEALPPLGGSR